MRRSRDLWQGWAGAAAVSMVVLAGSYWTGDWMVGSSVLVLLVALGFLNRRYLQLKRTHLEALARISGYAARSGKNSLHAELAGDLCRQVARRLRLRPAQVDAVYLAGVLHDIGELKLPERLLHKVYHGVMLTDSDRNAYRQHTVLGEEMLAPIPGMAAVAAAVRHHHERWDGGGYPDGLRAGEIPLPARIVAAVEAYLQAIEADPQLDLTDRVASAAALGDTAADPMVAAALAQVVREPAGVPSVLFQGRPETGLLAEVRQAVRDSRLLETMGIGRIYRWRAGRFTDGSAAPALPPMARTVARLAARTLAEHRVLREHLVQEQPEQVFDVYCFPTSEDGVSVVMFDVTAVLAVEREELRRLQKAYGDVIAAVTQGRMRLVSRSELPALLSDGDLLDSLELDELETSRAARQLVAQALAAAGLGGAPVFRAQVAVAEAIGNVFKHAGRGRLELRRLAGALRVIVADQGPGIPLDLLPQAFLMDGFSTKVSLGKGYTLMLQYMDRLLVATSGDGTTLILEKQLPAKGEASA